MCLAGFGQNRFVSFGNRVFQVSPTNQISALRLPLKRSWQSESRGSTLPHVAPDSSYIAFIRDYDLWLYDTRKQSSVHVTHRGPPYTNTLASVETLISAWAANSQKLLIAVVPGDTECVDCEGRGDWIARQSAYGQFICDLNAGTLRKADLPNDFVVASLLADGRTIGASNEGGNPPISIISPADAMKLAPGSFKVSQLDVSSDGCRAVAAMFTSNASYILKLDLIAGESVRRGRRHNINGPGFLPGGNTPPGSEEEKIS
jgi:Dipeptidyl peptidase IV (DPP IV) N-terminal region